MRKIPGSARLGQRSWIASAEWRIYPVSSVSSSVTSRLEELEAAVPSSVLTSVRVIPGTIPLALIFPGTVIIPGRTTRPPPRARRSAFLFSIAPPSGFRSGAQIAPGSSGAWSHRPSVGSGFASRPGPPSLSLTESTVQGRSRPKWTGRKGGRRNAQKIGQENWTGRPKGVTIGGP